MAGEGVELCLLLVKSHSPSASSSSKIVGAGVADQAASRMIRVGAIKVLDYAMMGSRVGREVCRRFVSGDEHAGATGVGGAGGLGTLFTALMGKVSAFPSFLPSLHFHGLSFFLLVSLVSHASSVTQVRFDDQEI